MAAVRIGDNMKLLSIKKLFALAVIVLQAVFIVNVEAIEQDAPQVDTSQLPTKAQTWHEPNP